MIPVIRKQFNEAYRPGQYEAFLQSLEQALGELPTFKVAETPIFVPADLARKLQTACEEINDFMVRPDLKAITAGAILRPELLVPNENDHPLFLQYDFAISRQPDGALEPYLIELQGFPSLYVYQHLLAGCYRRHFAIPEHLSHLFGGLDHDSYLALLRELIIDGHDPCNVVLLEIEPEKQNTRVDFWAVERVLGIKVLCLSKLRREGRELYYFDDQGRRTPVYRIYNRVIFDELLQRADLPREFNLIEEVDVEWAGHPNWFMRLSKYTLPFLEGRFIPESHFLHEVDQYPADLDQFVLKPLYSFSGKGVIIHPTPADLDAIADRSNFILQRRVEYSPVVEAPPGHPTSKCEIRMMMTWKPGWPRPRLVNNLVRLTLGEMVGVRYNKEAIWVGASIGFFEG